MTTVMIQTSRKGSPPSVFLKSLHHLNPGNLIGLISLVLLLNPAYSVPATANEPALGSPPDGAATEFFSLNIRMSNRPIMPPASLIQTTIPLDGLSVARPFEGPVPEAAILENDHRKRVAVLSRNIEGTWILYLLEPLPLASPRPALYQCAAARQCATDRLPMSGGLTCLALCLKDLLEATALGTPAP